MTAVLRQSSPSLPDPVPATARRVLVVDDSRVQRHILALSLRRNGYAVTQAASGEEALALCKRVRFHIVVSDWMMPGMSGLDFCTAFRALPREGYGYFILLTSRSERGGAALGLAAGADDFLAKPVDPDELLARIAAGERILRMARELREKNRLIGATLAEMRKLYAALDSDLLEARKLQQSLVPERHRDFGAAAVSLLLRPSGHVGGDLVGFFQISADRIGIYAIDVSGHGVTSAIMTARLAAVLSGSAPERNIALVRDGPGRYRARPPEEVAAALNRMLLDDMQTDQYFTLLYAEADMTTGEVALVQAGHPHPAVIAGDGGMRFLGGGGLPVGLVAGARYDRVRLRLSPGDRLLFVSDGITECRDARGRDLGEEGLRCIALANRHLHGKPFLRAMLADLHRFAEAEDLGDDISAALLDYRGPPAP